MIPYIIDSRINRISVDGSVHYWWFWRCLEICSIFEKQFWCLGCLTSMKIQRISSAGCVLGGKLYVCSGMGIFGSTARGLCPNSGKWKMIPLMFVQRVYSVAVACGTWFYLCGGVTPDARILDSGLLCSRIGCSLPCAP